MHKAAVLNGPIQSMRNIVDYVPVHELF